jgi:hypothetical protein
MLTPTQLENATTMELEELRTGIEAELARRITGRKGAYR